MSSNEPPTTDDKLKIHVEYCGACDYGGHCLALSQTIRSRTPNAVIFCKRGRQGSFEIVVNEMVLPSNKTAIVLRALSRRGMHNDKLIYSKLQTMALPDYEEVAAVVNDVSKGSEPRVIKGQQPINCAVS